MQRLIDQSIRDRSNIANPIGVKLLIRFQIPISKLPRQSHSPPTVPSVIGGQNEEDERSDRRESRPGLSGLSAAPQESSTSSADQDETNASLPAAPATGRNTMTGGASFRGSPVDVPQHTTRVRAKDTNHTSYLASTEPRGPRGRLVFQVDENGTPRTQYTQASGHSMNSHAPITSGAKSFEDYMRQFMSSEDTRTSERQLFPSMTLRAKTLSFTGTNCSVQPAYNGGYGVPHTNLLSRTTYTAAGG